MTDKPIDPLEMLELLEDPDYTARVRSEVEHRERLKPSVDAILAGIRFVHHFAQTPEGERAIEAATGAGFFESVPVEDGKVLAVPRFIWPDSVYEDLFPGHAFEVSYGVAVGRHLLWGDPGIFDRKPSKGDELQRATLEAIRGVAPPNGLNAKR